jgi:cold shock CspA family protein
VEAGTVKWFDRAIGYGYLVPDAGGEDLYLHRVSIFGDLRLTLAAGAGRLAIVASADHDECLTMVR